MKNRFALLFAFALLLVPALTSMAADQAPRAGASINVTLVEVPVNVFDRDGNPIRGLTADKFELTDEGKRRDITNFEEIDLAQVAAGKVAPTPAARRNFMLLFDLSNSTPTTVSRSRDAALDFVKNELTPMDLVAVATYTVENGFRLLTSFTTDRDALTAAVMTLGNPKFFRNVDPLLLSATMTGTGLQTGMEAGKEGKAEGTGGGRSAAAEMMADMAEKSDAINARANDEFARQRVNRQLSAFASIGRVLDSIAGRKQIILLSEGFDAKVIQGREATSSQDTQKDSDKIISGEGYSVDNDTRFGSTASTSAVTKMGEVLRRSDVVLHAIDIRGLRSDVDASAGYQRSSNEGLYLVTRPTGGEVFKNANDLTTSFHALLKQQEVVYVLGFQAPAGSTPGKFHNLKVKVKAPGAKTSARAGYYEPNASPSPIEAALTAGEILLNDVALDAVKTSVLAAPFPMAGQSAQVPVLVEMDGKSLMAGAKNQSVSPEVFVYAFDRDNKVKDFLYQKVTLDLNKVGEALQKSALKYYGTLTLEPGDYTIKTLVRITDAGLDGFKRVALTVPDFAKPTVSQPIAMEAPGSSLMVRGSKPGRTFAYPFSVGADSFVPALVAKGAAGSAQRLAVFAYNIDPKDVVVAGKLHMPDGSVQDAKVSIAKTTTPDAAKASQMIVEMKTDGLAAGAYSLDLSVQPKSGAWTKAFTVPVVVQ